MTAASSSPPLSGLTAMERSLLLRVDTLERSLRHDLRIQSEKIAALEVEVRARDEAITRLTKLLSSWVAPKVPDRS